MNTDEQSSTSSEDCAVCLQKCHHPTQLPCGHVFCFLCVKGVAIQSKKCAMCRAVIPSDYLDHPVLLEKLSINTVAEESNQQYQWYYEGRNGWWKYDERSNDELETAWNSEATECCLLLAGAVYSIDFQTMVQTRRNDRTRRRHVRRDAPTMPAKGVAGIKIINDSSNDDTDKTDADDSSSTSPHPQLDQSTENNVESEETGLPVGISQEMESNSNEEPLINDVINNLNLMNLNVHTTEPEEDT